MATIQVEVEQTMRRLLAAMPEYMSVDAWGVDQPLTSEDIRAAGIQIAAMHGIIARHGAISAEIHANGSPSQRAALIVGSAELIDAAGD